MPNLIDQTGRRYGRLLVLKRAGSRGKKPAWECLCDCGNTAVIASDSFRQGTRSCGCLERENLSRLHQLSVKHRARGTPEYRAWSQMKVRCYNRSRPSYVYYGGRGIQVCDEWREDFLAFLKSVGPKPSPEMLLDRIDNDRNYEPGNVRWADPKLSSRNRRGRRLVIVFGICAPISVWAEAGGVNLQVAMARLKRGWSDARAVGLDGLCIAWG